MPRKFEQFDYHTAWRQRITVDDPLLEVNSVFLAGTGPPLVDGNGNERPKTAADDGNECCESGQ